MEILIGKIPYVGGGCGVLKEDVEGRQNGRLPTSIGTDKARVVVEADCCVFERSEVLDTKLAKLHSDLHGPSWSERIIGLFYRDDVRDSELADSPLRNVVAVE